jgi:lipopolysaccharide/colanic/teichoic acid biosynthesis glycosyltransferase
MATFKPALAKQKQKSAKTSRLESPTKHSSPVLLQESVFLQLLRLERRRTERSGRPFMLVLICCEDFRFEPGIELARDVVGALSSCTRETDVLGWYEEHKALGLIMTEIRETSTATVEAILQKISVLLQQSLPADVYCQLAMVVRLFPDDGEDRVFYPDLSKPTISSKIDELLKRAIDFVGSLAALILISPAFLVIALLVKCTSEGPVFFCQERVGRHGKQFCFYKFRTMSANNDPQIHREYVSQLITGGAQPGQSGGLYKLTNDPRVTPLGRFLRKSSLDELPQFFNVLLNDMSLVGPRPPLPYEYERYRTWHKRRVLELKPGITGLWQIKGRSRTTFDEMVRLDIQYAKMRSVWVDLKIMLQTPAAMFLGRGAC